MLRVLVVDDDRSIRRVLSDMLAALDYLVVTASNGLEALDLFYSEREQIDLVLTTVAEVQEALESALSGAPATR